ncbi:acyltransferase [Paraburkholderia dipogonis]|uniref:Acyltransferase n=1 Tax=Paraburkholderia dipogonis TaxID=1211383 RepID=A0A4Y8MTP4_9BURK|nr:acyltransferase [Paraburkholderia dipogonis]TFE40910.1 acyltransferase [Paraburkholderia dipogonis]
MSTQSDRSRVFENVQAARALAALAVVAYHIGVLPFGQCGVDIFFVISGFIMSYVAPGEGRGFLPRRLVRILPLYWLSTLGVYFIAMFSPHWLNTTTAGAVYLVKSLLFIPYMKANGHWGPLNLNGWTLEYEMFFYLVISLAMLLVQSRFATTASAVLLATYCALTASIKPSNPVVDYLGQPFLLEFGLGVLSYWLLQWVRTECLPQWSSLTLAVFSLATMPAYFYLHGAPNGFTRTLAYDIPAFVFIASLIALEMRGWSTRSYLTDGLGAASYAIYLLHPYVVGILEKLLTIQPDLNSWRGASATLIVIVVVCVVGVICHVFVERPTVAYLNRQFGRRRTPAAGPA